MIKYIKDCYFFNEYEKNNNEKNYPNVLFKNKKSNLTTKP